jgi:hypothetical protein
VVAVARHRPALRRSLLIAVPVVALVVVALVVARLVLLDDSSRAVPLEQTVDRYRAEVGESPSVVSSAGAASDSVVASTSVGATATTSASSTPPVRTTTAASASTSTAPPPPLPAPGVYRYRTVGRESIDALGGTSHDYPAETTITVTPAGCGVRLRWDALVERWEEWQLCATPAGIEVQPDARHFHQFYGQQENEPVRCRGPVLAVPLAAPPASPVERQCTLGDDDWRPTWEVLGRDRVDVGGTTVDVTRVRVTVDDDDEYWEHNAKEMLLADDGLPVVVDVVTASRSPSPIGGVVYEEMYRLELVATTPLR